MKTLIFDFNGTLVNDTQLVIDLINEYLKNRGLTITQSPQELRQMGVTEFVKKIKISKIELLKIYRELKSTIRKQQMESPLADGIKDILPILVQRYKLMIFSSNKKEVIFEYLKKNKIDTYFDEINEDNSYFGKDIGLRKIIRTLKLNPADVFYLGDEVRDVKAANKAGINSVAVCWGFEGDIPLQSAHPKYLLSSPREILGL